MLLNARLALTAIADCIEDDIVPGEDLADALWRVAEVRGFHTITLSGRP
jgi:hypothetical protein